VLLAPNCSLSITSAAAAAAATARLARLAWPEGVGGAVGMGDPENVLGNGGDVDPEGELSVGDVVPETEDAMLVERDHNDGADTGSFSFDDEGVDEPLEVGANV